MNNFIFGIVLVLLTNINSGEVAITDSAVPLSNEPIVSQTETTNKYKIYLGNKNNIQFNDNIEQYEKIATIGKFEVHKSPDNQKLKVYYSGQEGIGVIKLTSTNKEKLYNCTEYTIIPLSSEINYLKFYERKSLGSNSVIDIGNLTINGPSIPIYLGDTYYVDTRLSHDIVVDVSNKLWSESNSIDDYIYRCYKYVSKIKYDVQKSNDITSGISGYKRSDIAETILSQEGICLDKASLLAGLLRVKGIEAKLSFGTVEGYTEYHAWIECYSPTKGWMIADPTFRKYNALESFIVDSNYIE